MNNKNENKKTQEKEILKLIKSYSKALTILGQYDFRTLKNVGKNKKKTELDYEECLDVVTSMRKHFEKNNELTDLFGVQNKDEKLKGIIGVIHQTFDILELEI